MSINSSDELYCVGTRVLLKVEKIKDLSKGGIALPQAHIDKEQGRISEGKIMQYGKLAFMDICETEEIPPIGSYVYFVKYAGKGIAINDEEYRIINDEDIYAIKRTRNDVKETLL